MRERAMMLDGTLVTSATPDGGYVVACFLPGTEGLAPDDPTGTTGEEDR
jgi:hypothetical protein